MSKLTTRERVICGAALVAVIAAFLPWASYTIADTTLDVDGWSTNYAAIIGTLLSSVAGVYLLLRRNEYEIWAPSFGDTRVVAGLAAAGLALVFIGGLTLNENRNLSYGYWLALAAGAVETIVAIAETRGVRA